MGEEEEERPKPQLKKKKIKKNSILRKINLDKFESSTKLDALTKALKEIAKDITRPKSLVFSQYTSMLDIIEWHLGKSGFKTLKLVGSMPVKARTNVLNAFKNDPNMTVILLSLRAGGEGLNLQQASHVFIMEPWWNPAVELQAIQRAHRIGQTRPVKAIRFITKNSIEERMHQLQKRNSWFLMGVLMETPRHCRNYPKMTFDFCSKVRVA